MNVLHCSIAFRFSYYVAVWFEFMCALRKCERTQKLNSRSKNEYATNSYGRMETHFTCNINNKQHTKTTFQIEWRAENAHCLQAGWIVQCLLYSRVKRHLRWSIVCYCLLRAKRNIKRIRRRRRENERTRIERTKQQSEWKKWRKWRKWEATLDATPYQVNWMVKCNFVCDSSSSSPCLKSQPN